MLRVHLSKPLLSVLLLSSLLCPLLLGCTQTQPAERIAVDAETSAPIKSTASPQPENLAEAEAVAVSPTANSGDVELPESVPSAAEEKVTERLALANIEEPQAAKDFLEEMRRAAIAQDKSAIASLIHYPLTIYDMGNPVKTYNSSDELISDFDQVVTPTVLAVMSEAQYKDLFINYQGAMIGDGEVWFLEYGEGIRIKAINSN